MRTSTYRRARRPLALAVQALVLGALVAAVPDGAVRAYPAATVDLTGHGWGHGRGMGQYGSLGYALAGWDHRRILGHYYSNTVEGNIGNPGIRVHLTRFDGGDHIVMQEKGAGTYNGKAFGPNGFNAVLVRRIAPNAFEVHRGPGCAGPWTLAEVVPGPVRLASTADTNATNDHTVMLQTCGPGSSTWYRGVLESRDEGGSRLVNELPVQSYLRGVVPRESPASWGTLGGGAGMNALRAQAVAARSYAWAENRRTWAKTCDTIACQVYGGRAVQDAGGFRNLEGAPEYATTDAAVGETAGQVRVFEATGAVARTEFSSSTGGWTAGGTFPAVPDAGDATPQNPNHTWTASIPVTAVERHFGIGTLQSVDVTRRNGLGDWGGRALEVVVRGTAGTRTVSGNEFRAAFGLKSDWFTVTNAPTGGVAGYWAVASDGGIFSFGDAPFHGSTGNLRLNRPIVGMTATPAGDGYWLVASDGGIFSFGGARFFGSTGAIRLNQPIVGMASTPTGHGYWLVASDGGIFAFGDARFFGSTGAIRLNRPVVGMASTPTGKGYWLVASDGGIFAFGDARFFGSTGAIRLNQPIVGMAARRGGDGYWMVAADGGIFAFGGASFHGSLPGIRAGGPAVGMEPTATGEGYLIATGPGRVHAFGDAPWFGDVRQAIPGYRGTLEGIEVRLNR